MNSFDRWQKIEDLFHAALSHQPAEREAFLRTACPEPELRAQVLALLAAHETPGHFLDEPVVPTSDQLPSELNINYAGQTIAHYRVQQLLGKGGMGEVYLATDTRLGRQAALKILPVDFAQTPDRLRRFAREARTVSALNHPNIVTIYDVGQHEQTHYIATEFVAGKTLREYLGERRLELSQALDFATQICGALAAAHEAGVVHRDIKPENVMVRPDGYVKVLDFGLAKLIAAPVTPSDSSAQAHAHSETQPGIIVGTISYLSPEQARDWPVDARTDLFSLGVVLYEMLGGERPFQGPTSSDTLAAILKSEPAPLSGVPPELQQLVSRALQKEKENRYQTAHELLADLRALKQDLEVSARLEQRSRSFTTTQFRPASLPWRRYALAAALVVLLGVGTWWWYAQRGASTSSQPTVWQATPLTNWRIELGEGSLNCTLSPNGQMLAFSAIRNGRSQIWVKQTSDGDPLPITKDEWNNTSPLWSPDGQHLAFVSKRGEQTGIWRIPALGGSPSLIKELGTARPRLRHWSADGATIFYELSSQLFAFTVATGQSTPVTSDEVDRQQGRGFALSRDEKRLVYVATTDGQMDLWVRNLDGSGPVRLTNDAAADRSPFWHPDGTRIIYSSVRNGMHQVCEAFLDGRPPQQLTFGESNYLVLGVAASNDGAKVLCSGTREESDLWRVNLANGEEQQLTSDLNFELWPEISPDGKALVYQTIKKVQGGDISTSTVMLRRLTGEEQPTQLIEQGYNLRWSPDGKQLAFLLFKDEVESIFVRDLNNGTEKRVTQKTVFTSGYSLLPYLRHQPQDYDWSADGQRLAYVALLENELQVRSASLSSPNEVTLLRTTQPHEYFYGPRWSPDAQHIAVVSSAPTATDARKMNWSVQVSDTQTTQSQTLFQAGGIVRLLGWTTSGQELLIALTPENQMRTVSAQPVQVLALSLTGQAPRTICLLPPANLFSTVLSPDGKWLAFTSQENERDNLWLVATTGGKPRKVTASVEPRLYLSNLEWAPNGRELYYGRQATWNQLLLIDRFK